MSFSPQLFYTTREERVKCQIERVRPFNSRWITGLRGAWAALVVLLGHDQRFFSRQSVQGGLIKMQVSGHELRRGVRQPFGECQVLVEAALEHFEELQVAGAGVFDVMRERFLNVAHVAGLEVHGASAAAGGEYG